MNYKQVATRKEGLFMKGFEKAMINSLSKHGNKPLYVVNLKHKDLVSSVNTPIEEEADEATYSV